MPSAVLKLNPKAHHEAHNRGEAVSFPPLPHTPKANGDFAPTSTLPKNSLARLDIAASLKNHRRPGRLEHRSIGINLQALHSTRMEKVDTLRETYL
eukprot:382654-Pelagomonas_calceolata.AAC.2